MSEPADDLCPRPPRPARQTTQPLSPPIYLSTVYECASPEQADALLAGSEPGYVYARDGHPNADQLGERLRELHAAERAAVTSSGMAAMSLLVLSQLQSGDHVLVSNQLYGRTLTLFNEAARLGIRSTLIDARDLAAVRAAVTPATKLMVVETISNPLTLVADLASLARIAKDAGAALVADNTLAGPTVCRPLELGADYVVESVTKILNGHSDVVLGVLCGAGKNWERVPRTLSTWGLASSPFDCWLALRGLGTFALRAERACANALAVAEFLAAAKAVAAVSYPGLASHSDHAVARQQFGSHFGTIVSFTLSGGLEAVRKFMSAVPEIPFCPSLGELSTTVSHPMSTSHRALAPDTRQQLGIADGTLRLSVGVESSESLIAALNRGLAACQHA